MSGKFRQYFRDRKDDVQDYVGGSGVVGKFILILLVVYFLVIVVLGMYWSSELDVFFVCEYICFVVNSMQCELIIGFVIIVIIICIVEILLEKSGGYIFNDIFLLGLWFDNMLNWEYGVLVQLWDFF